MIGIAFEQIGQEKSVQLTNGAAEATKDGPAEDLEIVINQIEEIILRATEGVKAEKEVIFSPMAFPDIKGTCECAARKGVLFQTYTLAKGI